MTNKQSDEFDVDDTFEEESFGDSFDEPDDASEDDDEGLELDELDDEDGLDEAVDDADGEQGDEVAQAQPSRPSFQAAEPTSKPFFKTPAGMATIGATAVVTAIAGTTAFRLMTSDEAPQAGYEVVVDQQLLPNVAPVETYTPPVQQAAPEDDLAMLAEVGQPSPAQQPVVQSEMIEQPSAQLEQITSKFEDHVKQLEELSARVEQLSGEVSRLLEAQSNEADGALKQEIEQLKAAVAELHAFKVKEEQIAKGDPAAELSEETVAKLKGRQRVGGFLVTDVSRSGEMSVIKRPSTNRVFTLFTGEVLNIPQGRQVVGEVLEHGNVVLLGTSYFIDRTLDPLPAPAAKSKPTAPTAKKPAPVASAPKAPAQPKVASGYSLNAIYDADASFGIINDKGDFEAVRKGQSVKGLGVVKGLDSNGDLLIGESVIRSVY